MARRRPTNKRAASETNKTQERRMNEQTEKSAKAPDDVNIPHFNPSDNDCASTNTTIENSQSTATEQDEKSGGGNTQEDNRDVADEETIRATIQKLFRFIFITELLCPGLFVLYHVVHLNFRGDIDLLAKFKPNYPDFIKYFDMIGVSVMLVACNFFLWFLQIGLFDAKFAFPNDHDLDRNFCRKISPSDNFVLDCLWFLTILDDDAVHEDKSKSEMEALIKHISKQDAAWKPGRYRQPKLEWVVGCILFAAAILSLCFLVNCKLLVYFLKACNHIILLNGKTEAFTASGPMATTQGILGYNLVILLISIWTVACCLVVRFVACYQGSKKLAILINRDIQGMKKKFGDGAGIEMAKMWNERIDRTRQWLWAGNTIHYLGKIMSEALEDMREQLKNVVDQLWFPAATVED